MSSGHFPHFVLRVIFMQEERTDRRAGQRAETRVWEVTSFRSLDSSIPHSSWVMLLGSASHSFSDSPRHDFILEKELSDWTMSWNLVSGGFFSFPSALPDKTAYLAVSSTTPNYLFDSLSHHFLSSRCMKLKQSRLLTKRGIYAQTEVQSWNVCFKYLWAVGKNYF